MGYTQPQLQRWETPLGNAWAQLHRQAFSPAAAAAMGWLTAKLLAALMLSKPMGYTQPQLQRWETPLGNAWAQLHRQAFSPAAAAAMNWLTLTLLSALMLHMMLIKPMGTCHHLLQGRSRSSNQSMQHLQGSVSSVFLSCHESALVPHCVDWSSRSGPDHPTSFLE
jgi:hypothetical protein